jgi:AmmeMemoRadiSam system protein A
MTGEADRCLLLRLARDAIVAHVSGLPAPTPGLAGILGRRGGGFVSLHTKEGSLRGCIGHLEENDPLGHVIVRCAVAAASEDPRFPKVTPTELHTIQIEVSLLGPVEAIAGPFDIEIGRHGLVIQRGRCRGLLLPQVATEWQWDAHTFLAHTCRKAGLPEDSWRNGAKLWRFEAEVFGETA